MKKLLITGIAGLFLYAGATAQVTEKSKTTPADKNKAMLNHYKDIKTGDPLNLRLDSITGLVVNRTSGMPVDFFVNSQTGDTVSAQGYIVNNMITVKDGVYTLDSVKVAKRGKQLWDVNANKELTYDKTWPRSTDPAKKENPQ